MCGFTGAVDFKKELNLDKCLQSIKALSHRGPDTDGYLFKGHSFLGHTRLSIIDLSADANQPFKSEDGKILLVYNGEIYNYKELKEGLKGEYSFHSSSDTEVLVAGYLKEGAAFFKKLRGIYAFAIYDQHEDKVLLVRDPSGVKPLYVSKHEKKIFFSSEIKGILPFLDSFPVNDQVIKAFLNLGYCPEPHTAYSNIEAVKPGYLYEFSLSGMKKVLLNKYSFTGNNCLSFNENLERVEDLLEKAVTRNLVADVPVSVALSGGIDSSLVYAYGLRENSQLQGLTVAFNDEEYDESSVAKSFSDTLGGKLDVLNIHKNFSLDTLNKILLHFDQPYADSSCIPVYYLTKAAKDYTKVLLGGDGGDELFNGYPSQTWIYYLYIIKKYGALKSTGNAALYLLNKFSGGGNKRLVSRLWNLWQDNPSEMLYDWHSWLPGQSLYSGQSPFKYNFKEGFHLYDSVFEEERPESFDQQIVFDYFRKQMLSDYLRKTDMMSMMNGVEYRVPLLDEDLTNFSFTIPFAQKIRFKQTKVFLRRLHKKIYPSHTSQLPKKGFSIPLDKDLPKQDFEKIRSFLLDPKDNLLLQYISADYVKFLFNALFSPARKEVEISRAGIYQRILMFYSLQLWYKKVVSPE